MTREADAQVGIFRHVVGVPAAGLFQHFATKMIGRTAERDGQRQALDHRQDRIEQRRVFQRELACRPTLVGIVDIQAGLQAAEVWTGFSETDVSLLQLAGLGIVFGIIDDDEGAGCQRQGIHQRARLCARGTRRNGHNPHSRAAVDFSLKGDARCGVVCFSDEKDVAFVGGPIEALKGCNNRRHHVGFAVKRNQDRVDGPVDIRFGWGRQRGLAARVRSTPDGLQTPAKPRRTEMRA